MWHVREFTAGAWFRTGRWTPGEGGGRPMFYPYPELWFQWTLRWRGAWRGTTHKKGSGIILCTDIGSAKWLYWSRGLPPFHGAQTVTCTCLQKNCYGKNGQTGETQKCRCDCIIETCRLLRGWERCSLVCMTGRMTPCWKGWNSSNISQDTITHRQRLFDSTL